MVEDWQWWKDEITHVLYGCKKFIQRVHGAHTCFMFLDCGGVNAFASSVSASLFSGLLGGEQ